MKHLLDEWDEIKEGLRGKHLFIFLDFDGTLTPIVETPDKALIPKQIKEVLKELSKNSRCSLAIITGRSLKDIRKRVGLKSIIYAGNHGFEIAGPKIRFEAPVPPDYRSILQQIESELNKRLSRTEGVLLENKGLSLCLHYRLVGKRHIPLVRTAFHEVVTDYLERHRITVKTGKEVLEVRPAVPWDKGKAVLWLLSRQISMHPHKRILPIYLGDDATDEDAFKVLKNKGLAAFVGDPRKSHAQYYLKDTKEVLGFLKSLCILIPK